MGTRRNEALHLSRNEGVVARIRRTHSQNGNSNCPLNIPNGGLQDPIQRELDKERAVRNMSETACRLTGEMPPDRRGLRGAFCEQCPTRRSMSRATTSSIEIGPR